jgi:hypothetical protein
MIGDVMVDYRRVLKFWSVMFSKKAEEKRHNWNKNTFNDWFNTLPSTINFKDDEERRMFIQLVQESFEQTVNMCAKGNLGGPEDKTEIVMFKRFFDVDW